MLSSSYTAFGTHFYFFVSGCVYTESNNYIKPAALLTSTLGHMVICLLEMSFLKLTFAEVHYFYT